MPIAVLPVELEANGQWRVYQPTVYGSDDLDVLPSLEGLTVVKRQVLVDDTVKTLPVYEAEDSFWVTYDDVYASS